MIESARFAGVACLVLLGATAAAQTCATQPGGACTQVFTPPGPRAAAVHLLVSALPGSPDAVPGTAPETALIAMHGHSRDVGHTFNAAMAAAQGAGRAAQTLVVAPLFQVGAGAARCHSPGVPQAQEGDWLWTCSSWAAGEAAQGGGPTSYAVLDALIAQLHRQWPGLRRVTVAGFSAGGQLVQRYAAFAQAATPHPLPVRYVVADPSSWLYFDPQRPVPMRDGQPVPWADCADGFGTGAACSLQWQPAAASCPGANRWKYGTDDLPAALGRNAAAARAQYIAADVRYLQGGADTGSGKGTAYSVLDRSCAALAQGPYRLQRGLAYAAYDRLFLAPSRPREVGIAPGCAHDVACVFPSPAGMAALFGD